MTRRYDAMLKPHGLTVGQFSMMAALGAAGAMTIQRLADTLAMEHSTTSRGLLPLLRDGLVEKTTSERDARLRLFRLSATGVERLNGASADWETLQEEIAGERSAERQF